MLSMIRFWVGMIGLAWVLVSCSQQPEPLASAQPYPNLGVYYQQQIDLLGHFKPTLVKGVRLNNGPEEEKVLDSLDWTKELALLKEADLSKPVYQGFYRVDTAYNNAEIIYTYTALKDEFPIRRLEMRMNGVDNTPSQIRIEELKSNFLQESGKFSRFNFKVFSGVNYLMSYQIAGDQKMIFRQKESWVITARLFPSWMDPDTHKAKPGV